MKINDKLVTILLDSMLLATLVCTVWAGVFAVTKIIECIRFGLC